MLQSHLAFSAVEETHVGRYHLLRTIGKGASAKVKLAQHIITGQEVAIKIIDKIQHTSSDLHRLYREIEIMKDLHHPNIVKLFEVIENEHALYIVMEYASGRDLFYHLVNHGFMSEKEAQTKFQQIVSAVKYCHDKRIVHRDLKTENLLLDKRMNIKLADFGLGTEFITGSKLDTFCGTPPYSARELLQGEKYDGPPVDVWSLGVILYFMVTGSLPFRGKTLTKLREQVLQGQYHVPFHMSSQCQHLLSKIFIRDPRKRATLEDILSHLWMKVSHEEKQKLYVQPLPDYDNHWHTEVTVNTGYMQEDIHDSLLNHNYNDANATYLILRHDTYEIDSHTSTLEPQAEAHCTDSHTPSSSHEVPPTVCPKPKQRSYTEPTIPTFGYYIRDALNTLSEGGMGTSMVSTSPSFSLALAHLQQQSTTAWAQPNQDSDLYAKGRNSEVPQPITPPQCVSVPSSSAYTINESAGAPEKTSFTQGMSNLSSVNEEQVHELPDQPSLPQTVSLASSSEEQLHELPDQPSLPQTVSLASSSEEQVHELPDQPSLPQTVSPASSSVSSQGWKQATGRFFKLMRRCLCFTYDKKDHKASDSKAAQMIKPQHAKPRSLKFTWRMKITSSLEPDEMLQEICQVLDANGCDWDLTHKYTLLCMNGTPGQQDFVQWRMEVCTLPRRTLNGVKVKRISGTSEAFNSIVSKITRDLAL
uniref:non-specific serine/threonine protein kinase n=1 Tax=Loxodonta africana TaxID=9785 RepID=G3TYX0_LOXAF